MPHDSHEGLTGNFTRNTSTTSDSTPLSEHFGQPSTYSANLALHVQHFQPFGFRSSMRSSMPYQERKPVVEPLGRGLLKHNDLGCSCSKSAIIPRSRSAGSCAFMLSLSRARFTLAASEVTPLHKRRTVSSAQFLRCLNPTTPPLFKSGIPY